MPMNLRSKYLGTEVKDGKVVRSFISGRVALLREYSWNMLDTHEFEVLTYRMLPGDRLNWGTKDGTLLWVEMIQ